MRRDTSPSQVAREVAVRDARVADSLDGRNQGIERIRALKDFFDALDSLTRAVIRLEGLGLPTIQKVLSILR